MKYYIETGNWRDILDGPDEKTAILKSFKKIKSIMETWMEAQVEGIDAPKPPYLDEFVYISEAGYPSSIDANMSLPILHRLRRSIINPTIAAEDIGAYKSENIVKLVGLDKFYHFEQFPPNSPEQGV